MSSTVGREGMARRNSLSINDYAHEAWSCIGAVTENQAMAMANVSSVFDASDLQLADLEIN